MLTPWTDLRVGNRFSQAVRRDTSIGLMTPAACQRRVLLEQGCVTSGVNPASSFCSASSSSPKVEKFGEAPYFAMNAG